VWGLWDQRAWATFGGGQVPFLSRPGLAAACASGAWSSAEPRPVTLWEYLRFPGHLEGPDAAAALMLTADDDYVEMRARQVACELMQARAARSTRPSNERSS